MSRVRGERLHKRLGMPLKTFLALPTRLRKFVAATVLILICLFLLQGCTEPPGSDKPNTEPDTVVLDPPSRLSLAATQESIQLTWRDNSIGEDGFLIERSAGDTNSFTELDRVEGGEESYWDRNVDRGSVYFYRVRAYQRNVRSGPSNNAAEILITPVEFNEQTNQLVVENALILAEGEVYESTATLPPDKISIVVQDKNIFFVYPKLGISELSIRSSVAAVIQHIKDRFGLDNHVVPEGTLETPVGLAIYQNPEDPNELFVANRKARWAAVEVVYPTGGSTFEFLRPRGSTDDPDVFEVNEAIWDYILSYLGFEPDAQLTNRSGIRFKPGSEVRVYGAYARSLFMSPFKLAYGLYSTELTQANEANGFLYSGLNIIDGLGFLLPIVIEAGGVAEEGGTAAKGFSKCLGQGLTSQGFAGAGLGAAFGNLAESFKTGETYLKSAAKDLTYALFLLTLDCAGESFLDVSLGSVAGFLETFWNAATGVWDATWASPYRTFNIPDLEVGYDYAGDGLVFFDASESFPYAFEPLDYYWDFGDAAHFKTSLPRTIHTYSEPGTYTLTVGTGFVDEYVGGDSVFHIQETFSVDATGEPEEPDPNPTEPPPPVAKEPSGEISTATPTFRWSEADGADSYSLHISIYPYGTENLIFNRSGIEATSFTIDEGELQDGGDYRFDVIAYNENGPSAPSNELDFTINLPDEPNPEPGIATPISPNGTIQTITPTFEWSAATNAEDYTLAISREPFGPENTFFTKEKIEGTSFTIPPSKLDDGITYRWDLVAYNDNVAGPRSDNMVFTVELEDEPDPDPINPSWSVSPNSFTFTETGEAHSQSFTITNIGNTDGDYDVELSESWIDTDKSSGTLAPSESDDIEVTVESCLEGDDKTGTITVSGDGSSATVDIERVCEEPEPIETGTLTVDFSVNGEETTSAGSATVDGPNGFSQQVSGDTTLAGVSVGSYTITADAYTDAGVTYQPNPAETTLNVNADEESTARINFIGEQESPGILSVEPTGPWNITATVGAPNEERREFTVENIGEDTLSYSVTVNKDWLVLDGDPEALLSPDENMEIAVELDISEAETLSIGTYTAQIVFSDDTNETNETVDVTLEITEGEAPDPVDGQSLTLSRSDPWIINGLVGGPFSPTTYELVVSNQGNEEIALDIQRGVTSWIENIDNEPETLSPGEEVALTFHLDESFAARLDADTHFGTIDIESPTTGEHERINVKIYVEEPEVPREPGVLEVSPDSDWTINASINGSFSSSERTFELTNVGETPLNYDVDESVDWLHVPGSNNGNLDVGDTVTIVVEVDEEEVRQMGEGEYDENIFFENETTGEQTHVDVYLYVSASDPEPLEETEVVRNGNFDEGDGYWSISSDAPNIWIGTNLDNYNSPPGYAAGGVYSDGSPKLNASGVVRQTIEIPEGATSGRFSFYYNITYNAGASSAYLRGIVHEPGDASDDLVDLEVTLDDAVSTAGDYDQIESGVIDVSAYAGSELQVTFSSQTEGTGTTVLRFDDVSFIVWGE